MNNTIYKNKYINIIECNGIVEVESILGGSVILPITKDNNLILIEIFRNTINEVSIEAPRGFSELGEDGIQTAKRELYEEIHCKCEKFIPLGYIYPDTGLQKSKINLFLALNAKQEDNYIQKNEGIKKTVIVPFKKVFDMCVNNQINDSFTLAAVLRTKAWMNHFRWNSKKVKIGNGI